MRICIATNAVPPTYAGGGMRACRYADLLAQRGHDVSILTQTADPEPISGVEMHTIPFPTWPGEVAGSVGKRLYDVVHATRVGHVLADETFDVVHCIGAFMHNLQIVGLCRWLDRPVVLETTLLDSDDPVSVRQQRLGTFKFALFRAADRVVSLSPAIDQRCRAAGLPEEQTVVIPNSVDREVFHPPSEGDKQQLKRTLGLEAFRHVVTSVGVLRPRKNQMELFEIFSRIADAHPETGLVLIGPTDKDDESRRYTSTLRDAIASEGLEDRVVFTGYVDDVERWLRASDVFAFASRNEGFPSAPIEAMSTGLACLVRRLDATTDYMFDHGRDGYVYDDPAEAADVLDAWLSDPSVMASIGERAARTVESRFTDATILDQYEQTYRALASGSETEA